MNFIVLFLIMCFIIFFLFEKKHSTQKISFIVIFTALSVAGRLLCAAIPSVQPVTFFVTIAGTALGPIVGFIVGALSVFISNFLQGQGIWTIWQMFGFGMIGLFAGCLSKFLKSSKFFGIVFAFLSGIFFGLVMNLMTAILFNPSAASGSFDFKYFLYICFTSLPFDLMHGVTNAILIGFLKERMLKVLDRVVEKMQNND